MKKKRARPVRSSVEAQVLSQAEDLSESDRQWATALAAVVGCAIGEAEKRVRRIRHDPALAQALREVSVELGPRVIVTNIRWTGETMTDLEVSVKPAPVGTTITTQVAGKVTAMETIRTEAYARKAMREDVTAFELSGARYEFARIRRKNSTSATSLPQLGMVNTFGVVK